MLFRESLTSLMQHLALLLQEFRPSTLAQQFRVALRSEHSADDIDTVRRTLGYLVLLRVMLLTTFLGSTAWRVLATNLDPRDANIAFILIGVTFGISAVNALILQRTDRVFLVGYAQLLVDVILVSITVSLSGSQVSTLLYFLAILGAAAVFRRHGAVIVAAVSGTAFTLIQSGVLPALSGASHPMPGHEILLSYFFFIMVALIGSHFTERIRVLSVLANRHAADLSNLTQKQAQLFNDITEGIISLDLNQCITGVNQSARAILSLEGTSEDHLVGVPLRVLFDELKLTGAEKMLSATEGASGEAALRDTQTGQNIHLSFTWRTLRNAAGAESGRLILFSDVSRVRSIEEQLRLHERMTELLATASQPHSDQNSPSSGSNVIGESAVMRQVLALVERVARSEASVLITGESGTGKELIASMIHRQSSRKGKPFVAINCGAIPENLIESELFGHKKGSFTGAVNDNPGLFRQASGGTILLDEVGELPLNMQTKLLRVLQERKVRAVGDVHDVPIDVRVVAATNRDLKRELTSGNFREDLYYRLNVVNIIVPPLRERRDDIPLLVRHFIGHHCDPDSILPRVSPEALQLLTNYPFPGNIRELENIIERAIVLGGHAILPEHLPPEVRHIQESVRQKGDGRGAQTTIVELPLNLDQELSRIEREMIVRALEHSGGLKKQAAELLGVNFRSFRYRLKKYGLGEGGSDVESDA